MVRYTNGITYQMWAWNEGNNAASPKRADELFESAINEFNGIDNESVRRNALNGLQAARNTAVVPNVFVHPNVHNDVPTVANR